MSRGGLIPQESRFTIPFFRNRAITQFYVVLAQFLIPGNVNNGSQFLFLRNQATSNHEKHDKQNQQYVEEGLRDPAFWPRA